jgi:hypothetical protein
MQNNIVVFVNKIAPLLASIKDYFPFYTRHATHIMDLEFLNEWHRSSLRNVSILQMKCDSTKEETYLLIASAMHMI